MIGNARRISPMLAVLFLMASGHPGFTADADASLRGVVLGSDRQTPATGASVVVLSAVTGEAHWSNPAAANGAYEFAGLPPGSYELAIEWHGSMYLAESEIELLPGRTVINLAAMPPTALGPDAPYSPSAAGLAVILSPDSVPSGEKKRVNKKWIISGSAGLVGVILALSGSGGGGGGSGGGGSGSVSPFIP